MMSVFVYTAISSLSAIILSFFTTTCNSASVNYVTPTESDAPCQMEPCLTFNQYTINQIQHFHSNSVFLFLPGIHRLNISLALDRIQNVTLQGMTLGASVVVTMDPWVKLSCSNCNNVEISMLNIASEGEFESRLNFYNSFDVDLRNLTITGNEDSVGCNTLSIISSVISISNSNFVGIRGQFGAALMLNSSEISFTGSTTFTNCTARLGGAVYLGHGSTLQCLGTVTFINNAAILDTSTSSEEFENGPSCSFPYYDSGLGGTIFSDNSDLTINSYARFSQNKARTLGGAITIVNNSTMTIDGSSCVDNGMLNYYRFLNESETNKAVFDGNMVLARAASSSVFFDGFTSNFGTGGAIYAEHSVVKIFNAAFLNNSSPGSGGALQLNHSDVMIFNITLVNNTGVFGGGLRTVNSTVTISGTNLFQRNVAQMGYAGAVLFDFCIAPFLGGENHFIDNRAKSYGGGLDLFAVGSLTFSGTGYFVGNKAEYGGGFAAFNSTVQFYGKQIFEGNSARNQGGSISIEGSMAIFNKASIAIFHRNTAMLSGGCVGSYDSQLSLNGNIRFYENIAELGVGGALSLYGSSRVLLNPLLDAVFADNQAKTFGGAIYFADSVSSGQCSENALPPDCFLVINVSSSMFNKSSIKLNFTNNVAGEGGNVLYGGQVNRCNLLFSEDLLVDECGNRINSGVTYDKTSLLQIFENMFIIRQDNVSSSVPNISSLPQRICVCSEDATFECRPDSLFINKSVMPGQKFTVAIVALAQVNISVESTVLSKNVNSDKNYQLSPTIQSISLNCTNVSYRLYVDEVVENAAVSYKLFLDGPCASLGDGVEVFLTVKPCPPGFTFSRQEHQCICEEVLRNLTENCYIDDQSISRTNDKFWITQSSLNETPNGFALHNGRCPLDYCVNTPRDIRLDDPDAQCSSGRRGILCGTCRQNYSLAFGSLHCIHCSDAYLTLVIPFALAGVALVVILFLLRLTVAAGTLNGLIFYANIVQGNYQAFFPRGTINAFTVFIAWLNLDFGIESCFYDGMDIYAYSWLQFLFPLYLWGLITIIILACHYSQRVSKIFGHNPIAVLDTVLLMSYSKILQAIIVPLSPASLIRFPNGSTEIVWLYDASRPYFREPSHIVLGLFAIFALLFLFLPYTFLLLCGHWLHGKSNWHILSWTNKIKPFLDAYHAPYRKNKRHWIGLLLLTRCVIFVTFAFNAVGDYDVNLLIVCSVVAGLSIIKGRVYEKFYNDFLESSFVLNLCIFSVVTFYVLEEVPAESRPKIQYILCGISVGMAFVFFVGIIVFHAYQQLKGIDFCWNFHIFSDKETVKEKGENAVTNTTVTLRELLLDDSYNSDSNSQLK